MHGGIPPSPGPAATAAPPSTGADAAAAARGERGTILCFDNGNHRAQPFATPTPAAKNYSRAVEFAVDEANGTVRQVWSYGDAPGERL